MAEIEWKPGHGTCRRGIFSAFRERQCFIEPDFAFNGMRHGIAGVK
jgi:hypothetical protein